MKARDVQEPPLSINPWLCSAFPQNFLAFIVRLADGFDVDITALIHDCSAESETGFAATCVEFPEANGQGETIEECIEDLRGAIGDVLAYRREEAKKLLLAGERFEVLHA